MVSRTADWSDPVLYLDLRERQQGILQSLWNYSYPYPPSLKPGRLGGDALTSPLARRIVGAANVTG
jgi:hypothetical protein